jgi:hypothetical protein
MKKTTQQGAFCSALHNKYHSSDQIKKTETCRICGTYGGEQRCKQGFDWGNLRVRDHLEDPGVDGRIIL